MTGLFISKVSFDAMIIKCYSVSDTVIILCEVHYKYFLDSELLSAVTKNVMYKGFRHLRQETLINTHVICCVQNEVDSSNCGGAVAGCSGNG